MENELNTPQGTETVEPVQNDTIPDYVYFDPDEDTEENVQPEVTEEDGIETTDDDPETAEAATEDETEEGEQEEDGEEEDPTVYFELPDGTKVASDEAVKGYLRQSDYTAKTTEMAEYRKSLEAENTRIQGITEAFIDHLSQMIPAAPEPSLALQDPNAYTAKKAQHEAAVAQIQKLIEIGEQAKEAGNGISAADRQKLVNEENQKLVAKFPEVAKQKGREAFFQTTASAAQQVGFSMDELQGVTDHRLFALAHWADKGMKAEQAKKTAKAKAQKAPPATPSKPGQPTKAQRSRRNAEAMRKLADSGSIYDAMAVDFD